MSFFTNFAIGAGNALNKGFQAKEEKRAELVKYRMGVLEKEKESYKATKSKAQEFTQQINSIASSTGIPAGDVAAALKTGGVTAADIMKGNYRAVQDAVSSMKAAEQPAQKPQGQEQPFPSQKPQAPQGISNPEMGQAPAPQGIEDMQGGPQAQAPQPAADPRDGMQQFADGTQGPTMQTLQQRGTPQADEQIDGMTNQQHTLDGKTWTSHNGQVIASGGGQPQEQSTMAWAGDRLRQGLFGRDASGAGAEGDRQFMDANNMSPEQFQEMQNYREPTYEGSGQRYEFNTEEKFSPVKMIHAAKLEDIKPGMSQKFYEAAKSGDYGSAMGMLLTSQEKLDRDLAGRKEVANINASSRIAAGRAAGAGKEPTQVRIARIMADMPEGPAKENLQRLVFKSGGSVEDQIIKFRQSSAANPSATPESIKQGVTAIIELNRLKETNPGWASAPDYQDTVNDLNFGFDDEEEE